MCGRLVLTSSYREKIKAIFADVDADEWLPPRYNITPAQRVPALMDAAPEKLVWPSWGFPPAQPKRPALINARSETVHQLPTFREAFRARRCIIFADGFYEWKRTGLRRPQPYLFQLEEGAAFALAGLWQPGEAGPCAVVLTTEANTLMQPVHDRLPVIFTPDTARMWLNRETSVETLRALLQPFPSGRMRCHPVSDRVNRSSAEGEALIQPVQIHEQIDLFR
jgi:putative SOS response-associated peptidase YedK